MSQALESYPIRKALISVYYKDGLDALCETLKKHGIEVYATGGTGAYLQDKFGVTSQKIESLTQYPELMTDG